MTEHGRQEEDELMDNTLDQITRYESGEMSPEETVDFFQYLVDSGLAWQLQGAYGREAARLIQQGVITDPGL